MRLCFRVVLMDVGGVSLEELFEGPEVLHAENPADTIWLHTEAAYDLLRNGKRATVGLKREPKRLLRISYIELTTDPWGNLYYFYFPPAGDAALTPIEEQVWTIYYPDEDGQESARPSQPGDRSFVYILSAGRDGKLGLYEALSGESEASVRQAALDDVVSAVPSGTPSQTP